MDKRSRNQKFNRLAGVAAGLCVVVAATKVLLAGPIDEAAGTI